MATSWRWEVGHGKVKGGHLEEVGHGKVGVRWEVVMWWGGVRRCMVK